jgi:hypothetical protein
MRRHAAVAAALGGASLLLALTGCAPTVQQHAEADLNRQLDHLRDSFAGAGPRVDSTAALLDIGYLPDFSAYPTDDTLSLNVTGWYGQDQRGRTGSVYVLGVGRAFGHAGLSYADSMVFRCVRLDVPLGHDGSVNVEKVPCPPALRKAAKIGTTGPEV